MELDALKRELEKEFSSQEQEFGYGKFYQSLPIVGIDGMRPTDSRIEKYKFHKYLNNTQDVLDLGCNCGFLDISIADRVKSVTGVEYNKSLVNIGNMASRGLEISNVSFVNSDYKNWIKQNNQKYDVIFSFAVHYWFKVTSYDYAKKLSGILNEGGLIYFESQDVNGDKDYLNFCREFLCRNMELIYQGDGMDDGMYNRRFFVFKKNNDQKSYILNRVKYMFKKQLK